MSGDPTVLIASPLEPSLVQQIGAAVPEASVWYDAELLPAPRYPSDHRGADGFRRDSEGERRWQEWLSQAEVLFGIPGDSPAGLAEVVHRCPRLRWVQGTSAGAGELLRRADLTAEERRSVTLTTASGVHARPLAEWAMLGLLYVTKDVPRLLRDQRERRWDHYPVRPLHGQHLVIVGLGEIGRQTARYARALGMRVTGVRRSARPGDQDDDVDELGSTADLPALFARADAVVLALPATPETDGLIGAELLDRLPPHAALVNVGRGSTLDEQAVLAALQDGTIAGAAFDVTPTEPLPADSPLWNLPNVLISPHTAALAEDENERIVELFIDNLRRYVDGRPLRNIVNTELMY